MDSARILILGTRGSDSTAAVVNFLAQRFSEVFVALEEPQNRFSLLFRRVRRLGIVMVTGQVLFQAAVIPLLRLESRRRTLEIQRGFRLRCIFPPDIETVHVPTINHTRTADFAKHCSPNVVVVAGTRIISIKVLKGFTCPVLNIHAGITPLYRGVHGGYWALAEGRSEFCGVTVHEVDAGIDTGRVVAQKRISTSPEDNFVTYPWLQLGEGLQILADVIPRVVRGESITTTPVCDSSQLRSHPTIWTYVKNRMRGIK